MPTIVESIPNEPALDWQGNAGEDEASDWAGNEGACINEG